MEATGVGSGKNVLDIGCGAGHSSALIKEAGATVVGARHNVLVDIDRMCDLTPIRIGRSVR